MEIVVCVKQIPDVDDIKWTKENNLDRANMLSKINPMDEFALDYALEIKERYKNVTVTVISMGPNQTKGILEYTIAKGASRAILLSDKAFSGSDTFVTAKILATAIKKFVPSFDLILAGQAASDGDTAQTHISIAQNLDIIDAVSVIEVPNADKNRVLVVQKIGNVVNNIELKTPCLVAVKEPPKKKFTPMIDDYIRAQNSIVEVYNIKDLELEPIQTGILGSPTIVYKAFRPVVKKNTVAIKEHITEKIMEFLLEG